MTEESKEVLRSGMFWKVDYPAFMEEYRDTVLNNPKSGGTMQYYPAKVMNDYIQRITKRATELDDPELNIYMLGMNLYDVPHDELQNKIIEQLNRMEN